MEITIMGAEIATLTWSCGCPGPKGHVEHKFSPGSLEHKKSEVWILSTKNSIRSV